MRATGIVRRIDDLGRVVIPKEIRRTMRIREGDPLEIYTEGDCVCFKRYQIGLTENVNRLREQVQEYAEDLGYHKSHEINLMFDTINNLLKQMEEDE